MNNWLHQQWQALRLVLGRMRNNQLSTWMISLVIAVTICVPSIFYMGVNHLSRLTRHIQAETEISVFLKLDADAKTIANVKAALEKNEGIQQFHFVSKDEAWVQLKAKTEAGDMDNSKSHLTKNPLPDAFFIQAKSTDLATLETLKNNLQKLQGVEQVLLNAEWAKRLASILALGTKIIVLIATLLGIALLVIIGNTVRMQILTQRDEIVVSKLIGATNSFIRTPFLYAGMLYGLFGGILAVIILLIAVLFYNQSVAELSALYHSDFSLALFNLPLFAGMILATVVIGWLGSFLAVTRAVASIKIN